MTSLTFLKEVVEPALFDVLPGAFPEFGWERGARGWRATNRDFTKTRFGCRPDRIVCQQPRGFYIHGETPHGISWVQYLAGDNAPVAERFRDVVRELARKVGVDATPLDRPLTPEERERHEEHRRRETLRDAAWDYFKLLLRGPEGLPGREYLTSRRGVTNQDLEHLELGYYPENIVLLKEHLLDRSFSLDQIEAAGLLQRPFAGRVLGAWRDRSGRIGDFWARSIHSDADRKYLRLPGEFATPEEELVAYGLDIALGSEAGRNDLVLVEGVLDVAILQARGFTNIAAVAATGSKLSAQRWEKLRRWGVRRVTLAFDNDPGPEADCPGIRGAVTAIQHSLHAAQAPEVFVLDPRDLGTLKDPDEFVRTSGLDAFRDALSGAKPAFAFLSGHLVRKHAPLGSPAAALHTIDDAVRFAAEVLQWTPERSTDLDFHLWKPLLETTNADPELLRDRLEHVRQEAARERERRLEDEARSRKKEALHTLIEEASGHLKAGRLDDATQLVTAQADILRSEDRPLRRTPILSVADALPAHEKELELWRGAEFLGLCQKTIPKLDFATRGLRGLMLLAAAPNAGKTALAAQFGLDAAQHDPETCFVFLSLEMPQQSLLSRMKCRLAHLDWSTLVFGSQKGRGRGREVSFTSDEIQLLDRTERHLADIGRRLYVLDDQNFPQPTAARLVAEVERLKKVSGASKAMILVDYLQVWPIPPQASSGIRTENDADKWRIGEMKTLRDALPHDAVLVISEARKPSGQSSDSWGGALADVMGSARGSYTPDMVFLLRPWSDLELAELWECTDEDRSGRTSIDRDAFEPRAAKLRDAGKAYCKLIIAKGRDGVLRDTIDLTFWYRQSRFEEGIRE